MALDLAADAPPDLSSGLRDRQAFRFSESLAAEEAAGRLLALRGRTISLIVIGIFLFLLAPFPEVLFYELFLALLVIAGYGRHFVERRGLFRWWQPYVQIAGDSALLAVILTVPNPLASAHMPAQMVLRFDNFIYFYVLLVGLAFGYQPKLVIWGGITGALSWAVAIGWIASLPSTVLKMPGSVGDTEIMQLYAQPNMLDLNRPIQDIVVYLIVAVLLALVVQRSRRLVERQAALERERGNLARYFPPATVDRLARQDQALAQVREQTVAVLFADLVGFTNWAERHTPQETIGMLREVHARLEDEVFRRNGTLDKFIGDGLMATFGTPEPGPRDAINGIECARAIIDDVAAWNARRQERGRAPVRIAVGLHYGPVVVGNIGTDRRLEFAVLGDTVNVASRLETMTRELNCAALISRSVADAIRAEAPDEAEALLAGFVERGEVGLRGRAQPVSVLSYGSAAVRA